MAPLASVVIPAHNEQASILGTLARLRTGLEDATLDVVVVCNGCTDRTADVVRRTYPDIRVLEIAEASKNAAIDAGNAATDVFPRVHLDADVTVSGRSIRALVAALEEDGVLAVAPARAVVRDKVARLVRWYYDVWEQLPQVREGLFGRGVFALSEEGQRRVSALPRIMSDDLAASEAFSPGERRIVADAVVVVRPPQTMGDLVRRRVRVATGNAQASRVGARGAESVTSLSTLGRMALAEPSMSVRLPVFIGVAGVARYRSRHAVAAGDFTTWLRDESSRA
jgi:cellulose synthase/poly-beta-1,6-N-acetylglucosamine synthase-like glycosyltransferase